MWLFAMLVFKGLFSFIAANGSGAFLLRGRTFRDAPQGRGLMEGYFLDYVISLTWPHCGFSRRLLFDQRSRPLVVNGENAAFRHYRASDFSNSLIQLP